MKNFTDPFRVIHGYSQARSLLKKLHPDVIFSKGGFVSVPVVRAAGSLRIPTIIHESDMTPGLANRLSIPIAQKVCCSFPETLKYLPEEKAVLRCAGLLPGGDAVSGRRRGRDLVHLRGNLVGHQRP